jgi:hypothetical protein
MKKARTGRASINSKKHQGNRFKESSVKASAFAG